MISNQLAQDLLNDVSNYASIMILEFNDGSRLNETANYDSIVDDAPNKQMTRLVHTDFDVSSKDGKTVVKVILAGGGNDLYYESTNYTVSSIQQLTVKMTLRYSYDYSV